MQVVTQKLQSLSDGSPASGDLGTELSNCRDDAASLRLARLSIWHHAACVARLLGSSGSLLHVHPQAGICRNVPALLQITVVAIRTNHGLQCSYTLPHVFQEQVVGMHGTQFMLTQ